MEFLPFDIAMQISDDHRTRFLEQAGQVRRPRRERPGRLPLVRSPFGRRRPR